MKTRQLLRHPETLQVSIDYDETGGTRSSAIASINHTVDRGIEGWKEALAGAHPKDGRVLWTLDDEKKQARMYFKYLRPSQRAEG